MPVVALAGDFGAGVEAVFTAAVGRARRRCAAGSAGRSDRRHARTRSHGFKIFRRFFERRRRFPCPSPSGMRRDTRWPPAELPNAEWIGRLRTADALLLVVSGAGGLEVAAEGVAALRIELAVLDLAVLEPVQQRLEERMTSGPRVERREAGELLAIVTRAREALEAERPLLDGLTPHEASSLRGFGLLGAKPYAVACNTPDDDAAAVDAPTRRRRP